MKLLLQPRGSHDTASFGSQLPHRADIFSRMREIEDAQRLGTVVIDEALQPFGSIRHRTQRVGSFHPAPMQLHHRLPTKGLAIGQPGEGGPLARVCFSLFVLHDLGNHQRFDFRPFPSHQRHKRSIGADDLSLCPFGRLGQVFPDAILFGLLHR